MIDFLQHPVNVLILQAVGRLFLISCIGYLAVRLRLLSAGTINSLSKFVITIALPSLILSTLARELHYDLLPEMAGCFVAGVLLNGLGLAFALTVRRLFIPAAQPGRRLFLTLAAMQNSGYLPIPLTAAILPMDERSTGLLLVFVYILVMGFIFWSLSVRLIARLPATGGLAVTLHQVANPPLIAMLVGLFFLNPTVQAGYARLTLLQEGLTAVGSTTIPLVLRLLCHHKRVLNWPAHRHPGSGHQTYCHPEHGSGHGRAVFVRPDLRLCPYSPGCHAGGDEPYCGGAGIWRRCRPRLTGVVCPVPSGPDNGARFSPAVQLALFMR